LLGLFGFLPFDLGHLIASVGEDQKLVHVYVI
jgi:hypothetical protein